MNDLWLGMDCMSCFIMGNYFLFDLKRYQIHRSNYDKNDGKNYPYLIKNGVELRGNELLRELFNSTTISDFKLRVIIDGYDHRYCLRCEKRHFTK